MRETELGPMSEIEHRKRQHMELASSDASQSSRSALWEEVFLLPISVPKISPGEVDLSTRFLGHQLEAPFLIAGMTGGHQGAAEVNRNLALTADKLGLAIGTGSQRAALTNPDLASTYAVVRETAPEAYVIGNLGMSQLISQGVEPPFGIDEWKAAVSMIGADAMAIHLNAVEELIQTEGDREASGIEAAIEKCVEQSPVPVIAKETGAGMSRESAESLVEKGVAALDVGGVGGTSFARIEGLRAGRSGDVRGMRIGETFADWGLPTAISMIEVSSVGVPVIATGGIRNGLHAAKAIALGASLVGVGSPAINAARESQEAVITEMSYLIEELRVAMTLIGAATITDLRAHRPVLMGRVAEWQRARDLDRR